MSKDVHTGLYSNEAYETLTLVSALNHFARNTGAGYGYKNINNFFSPMLNSKVYFHATIDSTNSWGATAEVTRDPVDGEVIIKDLVDGDRPYHRPYHSVFGKFDIDWARCETNTNKVKMHYLALGIASTFEFLGKVFKGKNKMTVTINGPSWLEPENYHGRFYVDDTTLRYHPERAKTFNVTYSYLEILTHYFYGAVVSNGFDDFKGEPWDPFKARAVADMRKRQLGFLKEGQEILSRILTNAFEPISSRESTITDEFIKLEQKQKEMEIELGL